MKERCSKNVTENTVGRMVFVCAVPAAEGPCSQKWFPVSPLNHNPIYKLDTITGRSAVSGNNYFYENYLSLLFTVHW